MSQPSYVLVDRVETLDAFLELTPSLHNLARPVLFVDLEGINLSRLGSISILQIYVSTQKVTYVFDVHSMGPSCFSYVSSTSKVSLKNVLESSTITKVFFDVRNDSDALYSHFGINLNNIQDLQLMELATRSYSRRHVSGLSKCIEKDCPLSFEERQAWKSTKDVGVKLFAPEYGGSYEAFNQRPLSRAILNYCVQDVTYLPRLWEHYNSKMTASWRNQVANEGTARIKLSQSPGYNGKGQHMALAPTGW